MKLPRDLSGAQLAKALARVGYSATRQTGSHLRLTTASPSEHHVTIPLHDPLSVGTLAAKSSLTLPLIRRQAVTNCWTGSSAELELSGNSDRR
jgi:predicted RNA binding protein YcfA (HicA-like mRNA interferase family)